MKIKLLYYINDQSKVGDIKDAAVSKNRSQAYFYHDDSIDIGWILSSGQFEIVEEDPQYSVNFGQENVQTVLSLRELLGQDMARIEFK